MRRRNNHVSSIVSNELHLHLHLHLYLYLYLYLYLRLHLYLYIIKQGGTLLYVVPTEADRAQYVPIWSDGVLDTS